MTRTNEVGDIRFNWRFTMVFVEGHIGEADVTPRGSFTFLID